MPKLLLLFHLSSKGEEPWVVGDRVCGLNAAGYSTVAVKTGKPCSCILIKNSIKFLILSSFCDTNFETIATCIGRSQIWISSAYMAHDQGVAPPSDLLRSIMEEASRLQTTVIIGADANAHHHLWVSSNINERGESLVDFISANELSIADKGVEPTFPSSNRSEVLDITMVSSRNSSLIGDWRVSADIEFSIGSTEAIPLTSFVNRRRTDWATFRSSLGAILNCNPPVMNNKAELDLVVDNLTNAYRSTALVACPAASPRGKPKPP